MIIRWIAMKPLCDLSITILLAILADQLDTINKQTEKELIFHSNCCIYWISWNIGLRGYILWLYGENTQIGKTLISDHVIWLNRNLWCNIVENFVWKWDCNHRPKSIECPQKVTHSNQIYEPQSNKIAFQSFSLSHTRTVYVVHTHSYSTFPFYKFK